VKSKAVMVLDDYRYTHPVAGSDSKKSLGSSIRSANTSKN
jgi:hypothetical protein